MAFVLIVVIWSWLAAPLAAIAARGTIDGLENEPFYPPPDPRADAVLSASRLTLQALAASDGAVAPSAPEDRYPALADLGEGPWILSLYVPTSADHRGPHTAEVGADVAGAARSLFEALPADARTADAIATTTLKLDQVLPGRRKLPTNGGYQGAAIDLGLDGIELVDDGGTYLFLPSWSAERKIKRRKIVREARNRAQTHGWSKERAEEADARAFRTRAWLEPAGPNDAARPTARANAPVEVIDAAAVRESIRIGGDYLVRETDRRGKITYEFQPEHDRNGKGYNMLRHAGTAYSIFQVYRLTGDDAVFDAGARAMRYFRARMKEDEANPGEWFILDKARKRKRAKLGGAGLGLLAYVEMEKARPGSTDYEAMFGLARHIKRMQNPDGSFESFYDWDGKERTTRKSIFYPGEAILGLVRLHQLTGDEQWLDVAERGADYLVNERWVSLGLRIYIPPDAWLIQGLEELDRVRPDKRRANYAFAIGEQIARHKLMDPEITPPDLLGADLAGISSLPNAANSGSFGEALSAAARLEARRRPGETRLRTFADRNLGMQLRNQFTAANSWFLANPERAHGGFRLKPNDHEIRNDYVQHNISGLFGLLQLMDDVPDIGEVIAPEDRAPALVEAMAR